MLSEDNSGNIVAEAAGSSAVSQLASNCLKTSSDGSGAKMNKIIVI